MPSLLEELLSRYEAMAVSYVRARVGDLETARDIVQEVLRAVLESDATFSSLAHLRNYFFVALRHAAVDQLRGQRRAREVRLPESDALLPAGREPGPAEALVLEEEVELGRRRLARLRDAFGELPASERELLRQRFWEHRTFREISEASGTPISTLKSREDRILEKLRKKLGNLEDRP